MNIYLDKNGVFVHGEQNTTRKTLHLTIFIKILLRYIQTILFLLCILNKFRFFLIVLFVILYDFLMNLLCFYINCTKIGGIYYKMPQIYCSHCAIDNKKCSEVQISH